MHCLLGFLFSCCIPIHAFPFHFDHCSFLRKTVLTSHWCCALWRRQGGWLCTLREILLPLPFLGEWAASPHLRGRAVAQRVPCGVAGQAPCGLAAPTDPSVGSPAAGAAAPWPGVLLSPWPSPRPRSLGCSLMWLSHGSALHCFNYGTGSVSFSLCSSEFAGVSSWLQKLLEMGRIVKAYQWAVTLPSGSPALLRIYSLWRVVTLCNISCCHISPSLFTPNTTFPLSCPQSSKFHSSGAEQPGGGSTPSPGGAGVRPPPPGVALGTVTPRLLVALHCLEDAVQVFGAATRDLQEEFILWWAEQILADEHSH